MKKYIFLVITILIAINLASDRKGEGMPNNIYDIVVKDMSGNDVSLSDYKGKVLLIVNVASDCGYTYQYEGLENLYDTYKDKGFEILAFPCNDFGAQEPGTNEQIKEFCTSTFGVTFPLFNKIKVLGDEKEPLYEKLITNPTTEQGDIEWNFEKFLISKEGDVVARFRKKVEPMSDEIVEVVEAELTK